MCGRYATARSRADLLDTFAVDEKLADETPGPDYNVAPTKTSAIVLARLPKDRPDDAEPVRQLRNVKWGLVPSWSKEPKLGRLINARAETVDTKPSFRAPFKSRRCLIPIDAFYEWFPTQEIGASGKPLKQPFALRPKSGDVLPLAGLYEYWRDKDTPADDHDVWLTTFTIITTSATDDVGHIHDRMPMMVTPDRWGAWLDPRVNDRDEIRSLMAPPEPGSLEIYAVSKTVNNVKNNGPELLEPKPLDG